MWVARTGAGCCQLVYRMYSDTGMAVAAVGEAAVIADRTGVWLNPSRTIAGPIPQAPDWTPGSPHSRFAESVRRVL